MSPRGHHLSAALLGAAAMTLVACGGVVQTSAPASAAAAGSANDASRAASSKVELIPGSRNKLQVAASTEDTPIPGLAFSQIPKSGSTSTKSERSMMEPEAFRVADVPLASIPDPLTPAESPISPPSGDEASEIVVDWTGALSGRLIPFPSETYLSVRVSVRGPQVGRVRIGSSDGAITGGNGGGVYVTCRVPLSTSQRFLPARWETVSKSSADFVRTPAADGATAKATGSGVIQLVITDAWFDTHECKATIVRRTAVELKPLAGGILFAYREPCAKCARGSDAEKVTLVGPRPHSLTVSGVGGDTTSALGALTRITLPVRKGGSGSILARYASTILSTWTGAFGVTFTPSSDVVVGVDVTQGVDEAEPIALAYASAADVPSKSAVPQSSAGSLVDPFQFVKPPPKAKAPSPPSPQSSPGLIDPFARRSRLGF